MAVINELLRTEEDGTLSFGDYTLGAKSKLADYPHDGDEYKVKTFKEITRLERNDLFVYESVPGTAVHGLCYTDGGMKFTAEGFEDTQITIEAEPETVYEILIDGEAHDSQKSTLGGKLSFSVELGEGKSAEIEIRKA